MNEFLTAFWISFPEDDFPIRDFGVTAYSVDDAYSLLKGFGYNYHLIATRIEVTENIKLGQLDVNHVHPNGGIIVMRGIWYPNHNTG